MRGTDEGAWSRRGLIAFWLVVVGFAVVRTLTTVSGPPLVIGDADVYLQQTNRLLGPSGLFGGPRPPVTALFFRLLGATSPDSVGLLPVAQVAVALVCWTWLAAAVAGAMRSPVGKAVGAALVLVVGSLAHVVLWDRIVLSESLATSLLAALVAASVPVVAGARTTRCRLTLLVVCGTLVCHVRIVDGLVTAALGGLLALVAWRRRSGRLAATAALLLAVFAHAWHTNNRSPRWLFPLVNVVLQRILPDAEHTAWFTARGMPTDGLCERAGTWASSDEFAVIRDPAFAPFRQWAAADLRPALVAFVASHPRYALRPLDDAATVLAPEFAELRDLPPSLRWLQLPAPWLAGLLAGAALASCVLWRRDRGDRRATLAAWLVGCGLLTWFAAWHGDAMEIARHTLSTNLLLHLGLAVQVAWLVDRGTGRVGQGHGSALPA